MVRAALKPGGRVFVLDEPAGGPYPALETEFQQRQLNDGRRFTIVKLYYEPDELDAETGRAGLALEFPPHACLFLLWRRHRRIELLTTARFDHLANFFRHRIIWVRLDEIG